MKRTLPYFLLALWTVTSACGNGEPGLDSLSTQINLCQESPQCTAGTSQSQVCQGFGSQSRQCNAACQWEDWSPCQIFGDGENPEPSAEETAEPDETSPEDTEPEEAVETWECEPGQEEKVECEGGLGVQKQVCNEEGLWKDWGDCVLSCDLTYVASNLESCNASHPAVGTPELCLNLQQVGEASSPHWTYQLCKADSAFINAVDLLLLDQNNGVVLDSIQNLGLMGDYCTQWLPIDFSYLTGEGPSAGAQLLIEVISPTGPPPECGGGGLDCTYLSGKLDLYRECIEPEL